ncbi:hypothetical protein GCM10010460_26020 [Microbacterium terrae]
MWECHQTRADLLASGMTRRGIADAVRDGLVLRARRDRYLPPDAPEIVVRAVRVGGRLTCLSLLELLGVFVLTNVRLHVQLAPTAGRMRSPRDRRKRLQPKRSGSTRLHWMSLGDDPGASTCVDIVVALAHAVLCQNARAAVASIDSALNLGLITLDQIGSVFDLLPAKYRVLVPLIDGRAQAGSETIVRLMVRSLGHACELQVHFDGVGFVDMVVDGWLVIECDSKKFHSEWAQQMKDYRRDLALAKQGCVVLRLVAEDILYRPEDVLAALRGVLSRRRG